MSIQKYEIVHVEHAYGGPVHTGWAWVSITDKDTRSKMLLYLAPWPEAHQAAEDFEDCRRSLTNGKPARMQHGEPAKLPGEEW